MDLKGKVGVVHAINRGKHLVTSRFGERLNGIHILFLP